MTSPSSQVNKILSFTIEFIHDEDPSELQQQLGAIIETYLHLRIAVDSSDNGLTVCGEDELLLLEVRERIASRHKGRIGELQVNYKETIRGPAEAEGKYIRQIGGKGNYAHCKLRVEPTEPGKGYEFINDIKGGIVPNEHINFIDRGVQDALELGILAGYPMVDVKVTLFDGSYHELDSNEMAFRFAGSIAFKEAAKKASLVLLEPVMGVDVRVPEELMGDIIRDVNSRRGFIERMDHEAGSLMIRAAIPLAELLSSSVHGRPEYPMHFAGYQPAPSRYGAIRR